MKDLLPDDRPREKLRHHGAAALGDNELVALVIGNGTRRGNALSVANALLAAHGGLHGLTRCTADDFVRIAGIGRVRAAQLVAALELGRRTLAHAPSARLLIRGPDDAASYLMPRFGSRGVEQFGLLDGRRRGHGARGSLCGLGRRDEIRGHAALACRAPIGRGLAAREKAWPVTAPQKLRCDRPCIQTARVSRRSLDRAIRRDRADRCTWSRSYPTAW